MAVTLEVRWNYAEEGAGSQKMVDWESGCLFQGSS